MATATSRILAFLALSFLAGAPLPALAVSLERITGLPFTAGESGNLDTAVTAATPDGRFLLISTLATNLKAGFADTNGLPDLLVYDREQASWDWITVHYLDPQRPALGNGITDGAISADGRFVAFASSGRQHAPGTTGSSFAHVYLFDRQTRVTTKVTFPAGNPLGHGNGSSSQPRLSADGRYLAYHSDATNLVAGSDTNGSFDVFQYDRLSGANTLVSHANGAPTTAAQTFSTFQGMSADGRYILLQSRATNLVAGFVDNNGAGADDIYLWDRDTNSAQLVSRSAASPLAGAAGSALFGRLSADGSRVAFASSAGNLVAGFTDRNGAETDAYVFERATGAMQLVSTLSATAGHDGEVRPTAISADGAYVFFLSRAADVLPGLVRPADNGYGVFRFKTADRVTALINHRASQPTAIALGSELSGLVPAPDGEALLLENAGAELVAGQSGGGFRQIFAYDMSTGSARLLSHVAGQPLAGAPGELGTLSADHRSATFFSNAPDLVAGDRPDSQYDAFHYDLDLDQVSRLSSAAGSGRTLSWNIYRLLQSLPTAGLFLFHTTSLAPVLPGIDDQAGLDPVLFDPRTHGFTALVAPGGATPSGDSQATFLADGVNFLLRSTAVGLAPGVTDGNGGADLYAGNRTRGGLSLISSSGATATTTGNGAVGTHLVFSANGRFVAYDTLASDAVAGASDANGVEDVVLQDRQLGTRLLISRAATPALQSANARSYPIAFSADGERLLFASYASNLISGFVDSNGGGYDLFLYRRGSGATTLVTHASGSATQTGDFGATFGQLSADGSRVFFASTALNLIPGLVDNSGGLTDVFTYDTATGVIGLLSHRPGAPLATANGDSRPAAITPDGRFVLVSSSATDLISGGTFNPPIAYNLYLHDRQLDRTTLLTSRAGQPLVAVSANYNVPISLSDDARYVVFQSDASNFLAGQMVDALAFTPNLFRIDRGTAERSLLSRSLASPLTTGDQDASEVVFGPGAAEALLVSTSTNLTLHQPAHWPELYLADLTGGGSALWSDGFETGDTTLWSATVGGN